MNTPRSNLTINTLVTHKKLKSLGIGCITKVSRARYTVNFGADHTGEIRVCRSAELLPVDIIGGKTITFDQFKRTILSAQTNHPIVILGNEVQEYVGIRWITLRAVTHEDLRKYPRVIE